MLAISKQLQYVKCTEIHFNNVRTNYCPDTARECANLYNSYTNNGIKYYNACV